MKGKKLSQARREKALAWLFIAPASLAFLLFMFWPLVYTIYLSFLKWNMVAPTKAFVGIANYLSVFKDPLTLKLLGNTALYMALLIGLNFLIPYVFSFVNTFVMKRGKGLYKVVLFMPSLISLVVGALLVQWIFNPVSGPIGLILGKFGLTMPAWSKTDGLVIVVISLVAVFKTFGYNFLVLLSGMSNVSAELIETARLEKTPNRKIFTTIVMPLTSSTALYVFVMSIVQGLQYVFTPTRVLTQGGPNNASSNIIYGVYQEAFGYYNTGKASALSMLTMIVFVFLLFLEFTYVEKSVYYEN